MQFETAPTPTHYSCPETVIVNVYLYSPILISSSMAYTGNTKKKKNNSAGEISKVTQ
jgi:hypothetical protein